MSDDSLLSRLLCSPDALESASTAERDRVVRVLVDRLGPAWSDARRDSTQPALALMDGVSGTTFTVVAGGEFAMGLTEQDVDHASCRVDWSSGPEGYVEYLGASARPAHTVEVKPFLCQRSLAPAGEDPPYVSRDEARGQAQSAGLRNVSEAELEWLLRDGGRYAFKLGAARRADKRDRMDYASSRFGVEDLLVLQWAADDWHASYEGAPCTSEPWMNGDSAGVCRNSFVPYVLEAEDDFMHLLAAMRERGNAPCAVRLARDLPL